jgi:hypothetical protein
MVMKLERVLKKEGSIVIDFESDEEAKRYTDEIDYKLWKKINRYSLGWKLEYLNKKGKCA